MEEETKLFIGGISWETTEDILRQHFEQYGVVSTSTIARDRITGSPRGFAFVTFSDSQSTIHALRDSHTILTRTVQVKRAIPRGEQQRNQQQQQQENNNYNNRFVLRNNNVRTKKIFVGGLSADLTEDEFRGYFEKYGRITDVVVMHDNVTRRPRGFGFISFESEDSVDIVMHKSFHELSGKLVEVKRAVPKDEISSRNGRVSSERVPEVNSYQQGGYVGYDNRFGQFPGISGYPYGTGMFSGGYYPGVYNGFGYGLTSIGPTMGGNFMLYGGAAPVYPAYGTHGVPVLAANGYGGASFSGKSGSGGDGYSQGVTRSNVDANSFGYGKGTGSSGGNAETGDGDSYPASNSRFTSFSPGNLLATKISKHGGWTKKWSSPPH